VPSSAKVITAGSIVGFWIRNDVSLGFSLQGTDGFSASLLAFSLFGVAILGVLASDFHTAE